MILVVSRYAPIRKLRTQIINILYMYVTYILFELISSLVLLYIYNNNQICTVYIIAYTNLYILC